MKPHFFFLALLLMMMSCGGKKPFDITQSGGTRVILKAHPADLLYKASGDSRNEVFLQALNETRKMEYSGDKDFLEKFRVHFSQRSNTKLAMIFALADREKYKTSMSDDEIISKLLEEFKQLRDRSAVVMEARLEKANCTGKNVVVKGEEIWVEVDTSISERNLRNGIVSFSTFRLFPDVEPMEMISLLLKVNEQRIATGDTVPDMGGRLSNWMSLITLEQQLMTQLEMKSGIRHVGFIRAQDTAFFHAVLIQKDMEMVFPKSKDLVFLPTDDPLVLKAIGVEVPGNGQKQITEDHILSADFIQNKEQGQAEVRITFNEEGAALFAELSQRKIQESIVILINGKAIMAPVVLERLDKGEISITGGEGLEDMKEMALMFGSGSLPCPWSIISLEKVR